MTDDMGRSSGRDTEDRSVVAPILTAAVNGNHVGEEFALPCSSSEFRQPGLRRFRREEGSCLTEGAALIIVPFHVVDHLGLAVAA
jgi:hypothetical protein